MSKGRKAGKPNYRNSILMEIVERIKPSCAKEWKIVASQYMVQSNELEERDPKDLKNQFTKKCCSLTKKPTGNVDLDPTTARANYIHESSAAKEGARVLQADSSDSEEDELIPVERRLFQLHSPNPLLEDTFEESRDSNTAFTFPGASPLRPKKSPLRRLSPLRASLLKKRKNEDDETDTKSKSSRPSGPRTNAAGALTSLATALSTNAAAAQQQQLVQAQAAQQAQMMQMQSQMMMSMMGMIVQVMQNATGTRFAAAPPVPAPSVPGPSVPDVTNTDE